MWIFSTRCDVEVVQQIDFCILPLFDLCRGFFFTSVNVFGREKMQSLFSVSATGFIGFNKSFGSALHLLEGYFQYF